MSLHSTQSRSAAEKLQRSSTLQTIQTLLAKLIAEELTVEGSLDQESKKELKLAIDAVVDEAWRRAECHAFGPKPLASKVTQLVISYEEDSLTLEATARTLARSRPKHSTEQKEGSSIDVKRLDIKPSSSAQMESVKAAPLRKYNSFLMCRSQAEAKSISDFRFITGPSTFGSSRRRLTEENTTTPGPSAYRGDILTLKQRHPRAVFSKSFMETSDKHEPKTPGPATYHPIRSAASK
jgi:hypothetical protein